MTTNEHQQFPMHPAADVFRDQLLIEVGEENGELAGEICRLRAACDFLGGIDLRLGGGGRVVSASLSRGFVVDDFGGLPCLCVRVVDGDGDDGGGARAPSCRLSDFGSGRVDMSGQEIGTFPGVADPISTVTDDGKIRAKILFCAHGVVEGELRGLSREDSLRFERGEYGDERLMSFLRTGRGLHNPDAVAFVPEMIFVIVTEDLRETIQVLGPLPRFETEDEIGRGEPVPANSGDFVERPPPSPSDESRLAIVAALGCADRQMALLDENRDLKNLSHRLSKIKELIGRVEISNTVEETIFSLEDGGMVRDPGGYPVWRFSLRKRRKRGSIAPANNIHLLELVVSGIRLDLERMEILETLSNNGLRRKHFSGTFQNGAKLFGVFNLESAPEMNMEDFEEMARGFLSGERHFPPEFTLLLSHIHFPLSSVRTTLNVLGVEACSD